MGKGSKPRPFSVSLDEFDENWNRIFSRKKEYIESSNGETENEHQRKREYLKPDLNKLTDEQV